ncbi:MAG: 30S ribosomal protein S6 [Deltaproteobacteria bacterium]|nr:30S ribosomal protein S6 [Deltaproteobacteria bacterium]MCB9788069.1 30S ribosomal protein S6 [Deltaproteobacteria bacterium]
MLLRKYETVTLVNPDGGTEAIDKVVGRMREAIEKTGGREIRLEDWGRRKTAYRLQRSGKLKAQYMYLQYLGTNGTVRELERLMKITEPAMLWQSVMLEDRVELDTFDFEAEGEKLTQLARRAAAARENPDYDEDAPDQGMLDDESDDDDDDDDDDDGEDD